MNPQHNFYTLVANEILAVEALMRQQAKNNHFDLRAALDHLIHSGGKRIRPNITLLSGKLLNGDMDRVVTLSSAIELLHTATLVHDDLIDGSLLRRGIPTLNAKWSPAATVLTGDFIFAKAAKLASDTDSIPVMRLFSETLGVIVNGEFTQLFASRGIVDRNEYYQRIYAKTASLFETSTKSAAILCQASPQETDYLTKFGYELGIAFQIIDDILDFTGKQEDIGKPVGGDLRQGLVTLPALLFIKNNPTHPYLVEHLEINCLKFTNQVETLIQDIRNSDAIEEAHQIATIHINNGLLALKKLPESIYRSALEEIAYYVIERKL